MEQEPTNTPAPELKWLKVTRTGRFESTLPPAGVRYRPSGSSKELGIDLMRMREDGMSFDLVCNWRAKKHKAPGPEENAQAVAMADHLASAAPWAAAVWIHFPQKHAVYSVLLTRNPETKASAETAAAEATSETAAAEDAAATEEKPANE